MSTSIAMPHDNSKGPVADFKPLDPELVSWQDTHSNKSQTPTGSPASVASLTESKSSHTSIDEGHDSADQRVPAHWEEGSEKIILEPYNYIASLPGKELRRQLMHAFNVWFQVDENSCEIIARTVTMMHNASLLIDDIQDGSKLRRGVPSAHEVYGVAQSINSANYVYFQAQEQLLGLPDWPEAFKLFNEEMMNLHRGQGMELYWRDNVQPPSEGDYLQMISNKTGGLFRLILRLLQSVSTQEIDVSHLVDVIGLEFQILDDYKNLCDEKMISQKGFFDDLTEGKFSYPVSHAIWTESEYKDNIVEMLKLKTEDGDIKAHVATWLKKSGSLAYTRKVVEELDVRARTLLREVEIPNPMLEGLLNKLTESLKACQ